MPPGGKIASPLTPLADSPDVAQIPVPPAPKASKLRQSVPTFAKLSMATEKTDETGDFDDDCVDGQKKRARGYGLAEDPRPLRRSVSLFGISNSPVNLLTWTQEDCEPKYASV